MSSDLSYVGFICHKCGAFATHSKGLSVFAYVYEQFEATPEATEYYDDVVELQVAIQTLLGSIYKQDFLYYWYYFHESRGGGQNYEQRESSSKANHVALGLLLSILPDADLKRFLHYGYILVEGASGGKYMLLYERHGNVRRFDANGNLKTAYCGHLGEKLPIADQLLGQMLLLQNDESFYLDSANEMEDCDVHRCFPIESFCSAMRTIITLHHPQYLPILDSVPNVLDKPDRVTEGVFWQDPPVNQEVAWKLRNDDTDNRLWVPQFYIAGKSYETGTEIKPFGAKILRRVCEPVAKVMPHDLILAQNMVETLKKLNLAGLAANQVGVPKRILVVRLAGAYPMTFVNPEIIASEGEKFSIEGCASLPNLFCMIRRAQKVKIQYQTLQGVVQQRWMQPNYESFVLQHELDHLNGIMIVDRDDPNLRFWKIEKVGRHGRLQAMLDRIARAEKEANKPLKADFMLEGKARDAELREYMREQEHEMEQMRRRIQADDAMTLEQREAQERRFRDLAELMVDMGIQ